MFRMVPSVSEVAKIQSVAKEAETQRVAVRYPASYGRGPWFHELLAQLQLVRPDAAFVRIPTEPDRIERALLELAGTLGDDALASVAEELRAEPDTLGRTLARLGDALSSRPLIVDGWSALRVTDDTYDAGHALDGRFREVQSWLSSRAWVITDCDFAPPQGFLRCSIESPANAPPTVLHNGASYPRPDLWERFAPDVGVYNAALAMLALQEQPRGEVIPPGWKIRDHVSLRLPDHARELLFLLGVHSRPLSDQLLSILGNEPGARSLLLDLGLCEQLPTGIIVEPAWAEWCLGELGPRIVDYHARLATAFAGLVQPEDRSADRAALAVLEAHRHYVALGDDERARRFARYSTALLVEEGKRRSLLHRFDDAARLYESVLYLAESRALPVPARLRGYVRHYVHFNRAKAERESLADTERGYREALVDWPENALFWSRLVRTQFYIGKAAAALATLEHARHAVPPHEDKEPVLIARTVRGLLHRSSGHLVDAVCVWDNYVPTTRHAREVEISLQRALEAGWVTRELALPNVERLIFSRPQRIKMLHSAGVWIAELVDLRCVARGATAKRSLDQLLREVREETKALVAALTHTLDAETRLRKQILLGAIDVVASGLDAARPDHVWVVGDLTRVEDGTLWIRTRGSSDLWFEVPETIASSVVPSDMPHLVEVVAGPSGIPIGPVVKIAPARGTADEIWQAWRRRMNGDD